MNKRKPEDDIIYLIICFIVSVIGVVGFATMAVLFG